jgi:hypothetical protein
MIARGIGPTTFHAADQIAQAIIDRVGRDIVLGLPLGLGKANHVANALYARAVADRSIKLRIFTALTLQKPRAKGFLERRFLTPFAERVFGGYPELLGKGYRGSSSAPSLRLTPQPARTSAICSATKKRALSRS